MANTDVTITLAGQFSSQALNDWQQKVIEVVGLALSGQVSAGTKPTVAAWNTAIATAEALMPPQCFRDMDSLRCAIFWQYAVGAVGSGLAVANQTTNKILDAGSYLSGMSPARLEILRLYLTGKALSALT